MIEKLASLNGRRDDELNVILAESLAAGGDTDGVREIAEELQKENPQTAGDCIKVLYEVGSRKPELIADYAEEFIALLTSKNNRLVWGAMIALGEIADLRPEKVFSGFDSIRKAYEKGSVITVDNSITVFAKLCGAGTKYEKIIFPLILKHLEHCRPKEVPQHAERALPAVNNANRERFIALLSQRKEQLSDTQAKRVEKIIKSLKSSSL